MKTSKLSDQEQEGPDPGLRKNHNMILLAFITPKEKFMVSLP